jgi:hypothetical protein
MDHGPSVEYLKRTQDPVFHLITPGLGQHPLPGPCGHF